MITAEFETEKPSLKMIISIDGLRIEIKDKVNIDNFFANLKRAGILSPKQLIERVV